METGQALLRVTGHGEPDGPWVPVGVGIHTGIAWVGSIVGASGAGSDFTALGDNVNIAARLASKAGVGEVLISLHETHLRSAAVLGGVSISGARYARLPFGPVFDNFKLLFAALMKASLLERKCMPIFSAGRPNL